MQAAPSCASLHRGWLTSSRLEAAAKAGNSLAQSTRKNTAPIPHISERQSNGNKVGEGEPYLSEGIWSAAAEGTGHPAAGMEMQQSGQGEQRADRAGAEAGSTRSPDGAEGRSKPSAASGTGRGNNKAGRGEM